MLGRIAERPREAYDLVRACPRLGYEQRVLGAEGRRAPDDARGCLVGRHPRGLFAKSLAPPRRALLARLAAGRDARHLAGRGGEVGVALAAYGIAFAVVAEMARQRFLLVFSGLSLKLLQSEFREGKTS